MSLKHRLSDPEIAQLQQVMLHEGIKPSEVYFPGALTDLLGKGLIRIEYGRYWPNWDAISRSGQ